ncbi:hypothetical protein EmuJ_000053300 [Echinococcus multilocularis]|uniref:Uncharacterized protein n=1 Tax=Echinococcus multilocularis TaxID=6211 RepID=A0A087VX53_ECHMU|nr:hypothetical protein EmuJ_000053300 [Echinococcus multilocularis]
MLVFFSSVTNALCQRVIITQEPMHSVRRAPMPPFHVPPTSHLPGCRLLPPLQSLWLRRCDRRGEVHIRYTDREETMRIHEACRLENIK